MMLSNFYTKKEYTSDEIIQDASASGYVPQDGLLTRDWWKAHQLNADKYKQYTNFTYSSVFDYVNQQIDANHPLLGNIHGHWCNQGTPSHTRSGCPDCKGAFHKTDGGHYFAIIGYDTKAGVDYIVIHDPGAGDGEYKYIAAQYWDSNYIGSDAPKKGYGCCPNGRISACETK